MSERPLISNEPGTWWLPSTSERGEGELSFDPVNGARLTLRGLLPGMLAPAFSWPALIGEAHDGTRLTLLNPVAHGQTLSGDETGSTAETRLGSQVLLRGIHVASADDFVIARAIVRLRGLKELSVRPAIRDEKLARFVASDQTGPREQDIELSGARLTVAITPDEDVEALLAVENGLPLYELEEKWLVPLQGLVILAGQDPTVIESLVALDLEEGPVDVLMTRPGLTAEPRWDHQRPLVPFAALGSQAPDFIRGWFALYEQLGGAMLFFIATLSERMFLENRLLNDMSFAESYHRTKHNEPPISDEEHNRYVEAMLETISNGSHRKHYRVRLRYAAAQGQRQRLKWLIRRTIDALPSLEPLKVSLADDLVNTRNAITHLDPTGPPALRDAPLYRALELLEVVIHANLLLDLGLSAELTAALFDVAYHNRTPFVPAPGV